MNKKILIVVSLCMVTILKAHAERERITVAPVAEFLLTREEVRLKNVARCLQALEGTEKRNDAAAIYWLKIQQIS